MEAQGHSASRDEHRAGEKSPDAFRTISEVSTALDVPQHVLRFWEGKFSQIRPLKRGGGRRYYRPDDVDLLRGIQALLYSDGYTIKGVQKLLRENGVKFVIASGRRRAEPRAARPATPSPAPGSAVAAHADGGAELSPESAPEFADWPISEHEDEPSAGADAETALAAEPAPASGPGEADVSPARREAAARLLGQLKALRRDYDLKLRAAKNGRSPA